MVSDLLKFKTVSLGRFCPSGFPRGSFSSLREFFILVFANELSLQILNLLRGCGGGGRFFTFILTASLGSRKLLSIDPKSKPGLHIIRE